VCATMASREVLGPNAGRVQPGSKAALHGQHKGPSTPTDRDSKGKGDNRRRNRARYVGAKRPDPHAQEWTILCNAVRRVLKRNSGGVAMHTLDHLVRNTTKRSLSGWIALLADCAAHGDVADACSIQCRCSTVFAPLPDLARGNHGDCRTCACMRAESDTSPLIERLLDRTGLVGAVDRIAGHLVVYPVSRDLSGATRAHMVHGVRWPPEILSENVAVIDTVEACTEAVERLRRGGLFALDFEGTSLVHHHVGSPGIALIQAIGPVGPCYLFDMCNPSCTADTLMYAGGLYKLLSDYSVTKVIHDAREDARALLTVYGCRLAGVFDTQLYHARMTSCLSPFNTSGSGGGEARSNRSRESQRLGLNALLHGYGLEVNRHKDVMKAVYPVDQWCWHRRPLPSWMVEYAVADVERLLCLRTALLSRWPTTDAQTPLPPLPTYRWKSRGAWTPPPSAPPPPPMRPRNPHVKAKDGRVPLFVPPHHVYTTYVGGAGLLATPPLYGGACAIQSTHRSGTHASLYPRTGPYLPH